MTKARGEMSQSEWVHDAIVEKLTREGLLPKPKKPARKKTPSK